MEFLIRDGDYVPDGRGGLRTLEGEQEVLQRVLFRLSARRGGFGFLPELGSRLHLLFREKPGERSAAAHRYVCQALEPETEVKVTETRLIQRKDGTAELTVWLEWQETVLTARVTV